MKRVIGLGVILLAAAGFVGIFGCSHNNATPLTPEVSSPEYDEDYGVMGTVYDRNPELEGATPVAGVTVQIKCRTCGYDIWDPDVSNEYGDFWCKTNNGGATAHNGHLIVAIGTKDNTEYRSNPWYFSAPKDMGIYLMPFSTHEPLDP